MYLEELVEYIEQTPKAVLATHWKEMLHLLPAPLSESLKPRSWQQLYGTNAVRNSLARVRMLGYDEKMVLTNINYCNYYKDKFILWPLCVD